MSKSDEIRALPDTTPACEVASSLGVSESLVRRVRASRGAPKKPRGRPRTKVSEAEACARLIEDRINRWNDATSIVTIVNDIRDGAWKAFAK